MSTKTKYITYTNKDESARFKGLSNIKPPSWAVDIQPYILEDPVQHRSPYIVLCCNKCNEYLFNPNDNTIHFTQTEKIFVEELRCGNCGSNNRIPNEMRIQHLEYA